MFLWLMCNYLTLDINFECGLPRLVRVALSLICAFVWNLSDYDRSVISSEYGVDVVSEVDSCHGGKNGIF